MEKFSRVETKDFQTQSRLRKRKDRRRRIIAWISVTLMVLFTCLCWWNETADNPLLPTWNECLAALGLRGEKENFSVTEDQLRVDVLDVGNADAIVVRQGSKTMLIDGGKTEDADRVLSFLRMAEVEKIDIVLATHFDADHIGGLQSVIEQIPVDVFLYADVADEMWSQDVVANKLRHTLEKRKVPYTSVRAWDERKLGRASVQILGPSKPMEDSNDQSIICRVVFGEKRFLFMADAELQAEQAVMKFYADYLEADVLKVGHHGAETSTNLHFLKRVNPTYAVISCGQNNIYGHPHQVVLDRLSEQKITCFRTDLQGRITFITDGENILTSSEKAG